MITKKVTKFIFGKERKRKERKIKMFKEKEDVLRRVRRQTDRQTDRQT